MYDAHIEYKQFIIQWNSTEKCSNPLPCWQICPAQFCVHWQTYEPGRFWQDPPFKHGDVKHSSTSKVKKKENYWGVIIIRDVSVFMDSACPRRSNSNENKLLRIFFSILEIMVPLNKNLFTVMIGPKFPHKKTRYIFLEFPKTIVSYQFHNFGPAIPLDKCTHMIHHYCSTVHCADICLLHIRLYLCIKCDYCMLGTVHHQYMSK